MSRAALEAAYKPSWDLARRVGLRALNCGYRVGPAGDVAGDQQALVWRLLAHTPIGRDSTVLDVGCGIGGPATWIFERHAPRQLIGLDLCGSSVHTANELWTSRSPRPVFIQADAHRLPVRTARVDVVFNCESALHYADKRAFLAECRRVLKPGGHLCLGDITAPSPWAWKLPGRWARPPYYLWSSRRYRRELAAAGFEIVNHEEASDHVASALRHGLRELAGGRMAGTSRLWRRRFTLRALAILLWRKALTYDLFTARAAV